MGVGGGGESLKQLTKMVLSLWYDFDCLRTKNEDIRTSIKLRHITTSFMLSHCHIFLLFVVVVWYKSSCFTRKLKFVIWIASVCRNVDSSHYSLYTAVIKFTCYITMSIYSVPNLLRAPNARRSYSLMNMHITWFGLLLEATRHARG